ncbi:MAG: Zn-ribbon domain-containing OB-fold protein [Candidatus Hodarchaeota archaeon]
MGFEIFGTVSFTTGTKVGDFIKYLEKGEVKTTRCRKCGKIYFPPRNDCISCVTDGMDWVDINELGELIAFSTVMYGPTGFESEAPYTVAVIKLPNGIQILGRISKKISLNEIKIGMKLKIVPLKLPLNRLSFEFVRSQ